MPVAVEAIDSKLRSASFTASLFGNTFVSVGSMTTTLVAFAYWAAYLPRTSGPRSSRRYSARISSSLGLTFFINFLFLSDCGTSAENTDDIPAICVTNNQYTALTGKTDRDIARFTYGMRQITTTYRDRIPKHRAGFIKADAMFEQVRRRFGGVPFKSHQQTLRQLVLDNITPPNNPKCCPSFKDNWPETLYWQGFQTFFAIFYTALIA